MMRTQTSSQRPKEIVLPRILVAHLLDACRNRGKSLRSPSGFWDLFLGRETLDLSCRLQQTLRFQSQATGRNGKMKTREIQK